MVKNDNTLFCFRCYHHWKKRGDNPPKSCPNPKCHSPYWNKPRTRILKGVVLKMEKMIVNIHDRIIDMGGGEKGIREEGGIYHATHKLLKHQNKNQRHPIKIGAFALNEFAKRHYFIDGNKRTAYAIAKIFMLINRCHLMIDYRNATSFMLKIAKYESEITYEEIKKWLNNNCKIIEDEEVKSYLNKAFVELTLGGEENDK